MDIKTELIRTGPPTPEELYKYTTWDKNDRLNGSKHKLLTVPQLYFASIKSFNDPFDCQLPRGWASKTNEEILSYLEKRYGDDREGLSKIERHLETDRKGYLNSLNEADIKMTDSQSGVFCLSSSPTNSLLWAHYSAGHTGYCIGYNTTRIEEFMNSYCNSSNFSFGLINVEYEVARPILDPFLDDDIEWIFQRYRYKAKDWSYEQEYRIVLLNPEQLQKNQRQVEIVAECISEIILGCKLKRDTEAEIRQSVEKLRSSNPELKLLRAIMSDNSFDYELISLD